MTRFWLRRRAQALALSAALAAGLAPGALPTAEEATAPGGWEPLEAGLELGTFSAPRPSPVGDSKIRVLRIDPGRFELVLLNASADPKGRPRTAKQWCEAEGLVAAINASMYQTDHRTSVALMRTRTHVNNPRLTKDMAILAFDRRSPEVPPVAIIDRQCDDFEALRERYGTLVQSIRMRSCEGKNVWSVQPRMWSTAAIGLDRAGRVLFIHSRSPFRVHDLIDALGELPLDLERALYAEGGPEAQLYARSGGREIDLVGSFETGLNLNDDNRWAWPVPNVVGLRRRGE